MNHEIAAFIRGLRERTRDRPTSLPDGDAVVRIARQIDPQPHAPADLAARFAHAAGAAGACVHGASSETWPLLAARLLSDDGVRSLRLTGASLPPALAQQADELREALCRERIEVHEDGASQALAPDRKRRRDEVLFRVDAGVTGVTAAIAETGTLVCESGPALPRSDSLVPPLHLALVHTGQIVPDLCDYFRALAGRALPASATLITGPSKTADIEGVLVTGVHGPGKVVIVLVDTAPSHDAMPGKNHASADASAHAPGAGQQETSAA